MPFIEKPHKNINMDMEKHVMDGASDSNNTNHTPSSCVNDNNNKSYKGVRKRKWGKWVSEIRLPNSRERIWLGSYDSPEKAARAFDAALYCLRGRHANFNFSNTPSNMDTNVVPQSLTPQEIQEVAAKFANQDPLLLKPLHQEEESQRSSSGVDGNSSKIISKSENIGESSTSTTTTYYTPTTTMDECDGTVQVDHGDMDWTFLNVFDYSNEVFPFGPEYGLYSELQKMHSGSGELLYSTPPPSSLPPFEGNQGLIEADDDDPFSHQSFLWNWNF